MALRYCSTRALTNSSYGLPFGGVVCACVGRYCGERCQREAWAAHKAVCVVAAGTGSSCGSCTGPTAAARTVGLDAAFRDGEAIHATWTVGDTGGETLHSSERPQREVEITRVIL